MMRPTGCLFPPSASCTALVSLACLLAVFSFASLIRLVPRPAVRVVSRFVASSRHAYPSGMSVSFHLLISSCLLLLRPFASLCLLFPFLVSAGGASIISLSSRHASRLSPLRSARPRLGMLRYTVYCGDGDRRMWGIRASVP